MELLDHMVVLFLTWWGTSRLFSIMTAPMYIPKNSVENSLLSISSPTLVISLFKNYFWLKDNGFTILHWFLTYININQSFVHMTAILTGVKWYITVICIGISLKINDVQAPSCVPFGHLYVSFGKMSTQFFCPFLNWIFFFFFLLLSCMSSLDINPLLDIIYHLNRGRGETALRGKQTAFRKDKWALKRIDGRSESIAIRSA